MLEFFKALECKLWTRKCDGLCGDLNYHEDHLNWYGRLRLGVNK